jgi:hypothetical protein
LRVLLSSTARTAGAFLGTAIIVSGLTLASSPAFAMSPDRFFHASPVSDHVLGEMRGGFDISGMHFNFGYEFLAKVNGTEFSFPVLSLDLNGVTGGQLKDASGNILSTNAIGVVNQLVVDAGGHVTAEENPSTTVAGLLNVIQNAMDGAQIQTSSKLTIDITNSGINAQTLLGNINASRITDSLRFQSILGSIH